MTPNLALVTKGDNAQSVINAFLAGRSPQTLRAYSGDLESFAGYLKAENSEIAAEQTRALQSFKHISIRIEMFRVLWLTWFPKPRLSLEVIKMKARREMAKEDRIAKLQAEVLHLSLGLQFLGRTMDQMPYGDKDLKLAIPGISTVVREFGSKLAKLSEELDIVSLDRLK